MRSILSLWMFVICTLSHAQPAPQPVTLPATPMGAYSVLERSDWRRYDNGRYVGLVRHEVRGSVIPQQAVYGTNVLFQGNFFILASTLRDMRQAAQPVDAVISVSFELDENGEIIFEHDRGFPRLRGFPAFPAEQVVPGSKWQAPGIRASDPLNSGQPVIIPFIAEYEYQGIENYRDTRVHRIHAVYASRYYSDIPEPDGIVRVNGTHRVAILIRVDDGLPVFMHDELDVTYFMADRSNVQFKGFTLTFGGGIVPMIREQVITSIEETVKLDDLGVDLVSVPGGIRLTVKDIRFVPNSAEFLPEERQRLDLIAEALLQIPDRNFLVEGHAAATGNPEGEMTLSIERARRMVDELVRRGLSTSRFMYKGWGGTMPIGDNTTDAGRNINRRVEITILE
ncbi:MAG: OmpA family protein [Treponema sp.]|nr:OmpA family protein [Treponema sp.]